MEPINGKWDLPQNFTKEKFRQLKKKEPEKSQPTKTPAYTYTYKYKRRFFGTCQVFSVNFQFSRKKREDFSSSLLSF